jgi:ABC-type sugar transport system permease subunit
MTALPSSSSAADSNRRGWRRESRRVLRRPQFWFAVVVLVPTLLWYFIFQLWPMVRSFHTAVVAYKILEPFNSPFVGLDNFRQLAENQFFLPAVLNTLKWAVLNFALMLPICLAVSVTLSKIRRGRNFYQALIYLPVVMSLVAISLLFRMLLDPDVGQFNRFLNALGLPGSTWLRDESSAMLTMAGIAVWKSMGIYVVILTAGLLNIPSELYDAARVDGANDWTEFQHITLPLLGHTLTLVTTMLVIGGLQEFTLPSLLTGGGPGVSTLMANMLIYSEAFQNLRFGTATAMAILQLVLILFITRILIRLITPKWSY